MINSIDAVRRYGIGADLLTPKENVIINKELIPILKMMDDARRAFLLGDRIKAKYLMIDAMSKLREKYRKLMINALNNYMNYIKKYKKQKTKKKQLSEINDIGLFDIFSKIKNRFSNFARGVKQKFSAVGRGARSILNKMKQIVTAPIDKVKQIGKTLKKYILYIALAILGVAGVAAYIFLKRPVPMPI